LDSGPATKNVGQYFDESFIDEGLSVGGGIEFDLITTDYFGRINVILDISEKSLNSGGYLF